MSEEKKSGGLSIGDLPGFGKISESVLSAIRAAVGTLYRPRAIRNEGFAQADAEAYKVVQLAEAETKAKLIKEGKFVSQNENRDDQKSVAIHSPDGHGEFATSIEALRIHASDRLVFVELKRQDRLEALFQKSLIYSEEKENLGGSARPIDDDWIIAFINYAQNVSQQDISRIWARILASQATNGEPTISRATLDALRLLEPSGARMFEIVARIYMHTGQIMSTDEVKDLEFNIDSLAAMNLVDIGFLRRVDIRESSLDFNDGTFLFIKSESINYFKRSGGIFEIENDIESHMKEIRIDKCNLTSRGIELAAILFPGFYDYIGKKNSNPVNLTKALNKKVTRKLTVEWARTFSSFGIIVCASRLEWTQFIDAEGREVRQSSHRIEEYFDTKRNNWRRVARS